MTPDSDSPHEFEVYTVVVLRRPPEAPELPDEELDALQAHHLAYRAGLRRQGVLAVNGPFDDQRDSSWRGMSIFACDPEQAARLSEADPSVIAGRLAYEVMSWWVPPGSLAFPLLSHPVGTRRRMPR
jgi:uncharacterized protein YciI